MNARRLGSSLALLASLSPWSSACSAPEDQGAALSVAISTDLPLDVLNVVSVQSLDSVGGVAIDTGWFLVEEGCLPAADGFRALGSFGVPKGQLTSARLLVVGYHRQPDGALTPIVQQRVDGVFGGGLTAASVKLAEKCTNIPACSADLTCGVDSGMCETVPTFRDDQAALPASGTPCLKVTSSHAVGDVLPPKPSGTALCVTGDDTCPDGCDWTRDDDCRLRLGKACTPNKGPPCRTGSECVNGVCCDQKCAGECQRCDLAGSPGVCAHVPYTAGTMAPLNEPDFQTQCVADHVQLSCAAGSCLPKCMDGYAACDAPFATNGCTTKLGDAKHCRNCAESCAYGYCGQDGCVWHDTLPRDADGKPNTANSAPVATGRLYAKGIATSPGDMTLRGLGALVHPSIAGRLLRIAIYVQTASTTDLFAFTADLKTVDHPESLVEVAQGALRVEALLDLPKRLKYGDFYMVAFEVSDDTQMFTTADSAVLWNVQPMPYGDFPQQLARDANLERLARFQVYAITTPD